MGIGIVLYSVCKYLKELKFIHTKAGRIITSLIEGVSIIGIVYFMYIKETTYPVTFYFMDVCCSVLICCNVLHNTVLSDILENKFSEWLGKISVGIYFSHSAVIVLYYYEIQGLIWNSQLKLWVVMLTGIMLAGIALDKIVEKLNKKQVV